MVKGFKDAPQGSFDLDLSDTICGPIRYHHADEEGPHKNSSQILGFAEKISSIYHGTQSNRWSIEVRRGLEEKYQFHDEQTDKIIDMIWEKVCEVKEMFDLEPGEIKPFSQIMQ